MQLSPRDPTDVELAWITGIWEGEGSWVFKKARTRKHKNGKHYTEKPHLVMCLSMTDGDVVERVAAVMDGRKVTHTDGGPSHKAAGCKPVFSLHISGSSAIRWTELMKPLLGERRRQKFEDIKEKINASA